MRRSAQIYYARETQVPPVLQRFTRLASDQDGHMVTQRDHVPVLSARLCGAGGSVQRYRRPKRRTHISDRGRGSRNRPCQDVRLSKNSHCMTDRGARYKVYEPINVPQLSTPHRWDPCAGCRFRERRRRRQSLFSARAERHAGWRASRFRYRIDHGTSLLQWRCAQKERGEGPGGPSGRAHN